MLRKGLLELRCPFRRKISTSTTTNIAANSDRSAITGKALESDDPLSIYIHWPYCEFKCHFCNFNKYLNPPLSSPSNEDQLAKSLLTELQTLLRWFPTKRRVTSVYFGGGTPSLASPHTVGLVLDAISKWCNLEPDAEISLESNPTTAEIDKMQGFREAGINRYSLGVQTLDDEVLTRMGRRHTGKEGLEAILRARKLFERGVTFDMMFGFQDQTAEQWRMQLEVGRNHVSIYQLSLEYGTPLYRDYKAGRYRVPDEDAQADMYDAALEVTASHGLHHYEVSSYASSPDSESWHNMSYWFGQDFIGIGPGAHGRFTIREPNRWIEQCKKLGHG
ncbi:hypothetical protein EV182_000257 [Spiromyces aspiralis]|uniref:Uncharacterized protein n=1 Tax=Spiromyces aspiralis TaxID=68401 RepID=A0ACC1HUR4_9FUNG|nr:hypothetical protein EV182_000257 [Spiromyces aspiralis]